MKKTLYTIMFGILGAVVGAIVSWSTEFAYLTMLDYPSIDGVSAAVGYSFEERDLFNYIYLVFVAIGIIIGVVEGLKTWDHIYSDRIIPLRQQNKYIKVFLYAALAVGIVAFAAVTDVFGFEQMGERLDKEKESSLTDPLSQTSILYGVVLIDDTACMGNGGINADEVRECLPRPYQTKFALFREGKIEKVVESNENGSFEVSLLPGTYEARKLPDDRAAVNVQNMVVSTRAGERTKLEVRYAETSKN